MLIFIFAFLSNSLEISNFHYLYVLDNDLSIENVNDQNGKNHSTNIYKNNAKGIYNSILNKKCKNVTLTTK